MPNLIISDSRRRAIIAEFIESKPVEQYLERKKYEKMCWLALDVVPDRDLKIPVFLEQIYERKINAYESGLSKLKLWLADPTTQHDGSFASSYKQMVANLFNDPSITVDFLNQRHPEIREIINKRALDSLQWYTDWMNTVDPDHLASLAKFKPALARKLGGILLDAHQFLMENPKALELFKSKRDELLSKYQSKLDRAVQFLTKIPLEVMESAPLLQKTLDEYFENYSPELRNGDQERALTSAIQDRQANLKNLPSKALMESFKEKKVNSISGLLASMNNRSQMQHP